MKVLNVKNLEFIEFTIMKNSIEKYWQNSNKCAKIKYTIKKNCYEDESKLQ